MALPPSAAAWARGGACSAEPCCTRGWPGRWDKACGSCRGAGFCRRSRTGNRSKKDDDMVGEWMAMGLASRVIQAARAVPRRQDALTVRRRNKLCETVSSITGRTLSRIVKNAQKPSAGRALLSQRAVGHPRLRDPMWRLRGAEERINGDRVSVMPPARKRTKQTKLWVDAFFAKSPNARLRARMRASARSAKPKSGIQCGGCAGRRRGSTATGFR